MRLASGVDLSAEVGSSRAGLGEVTGEDGLDEGPEDDLGTTGSCKFHFMRIGNMVFTQSGEEPSIG